MSSNSSIAIIVVGVLLLFFVLSTIILIVVVIKSVGVCGCRVCVCGCGCRVGQVGVWLQGGTGRGVAGLDAFLACDSITYPNTHTLLQLG